MASVTKKRTPKTKTEDTSAPIAAAPVASVVSAAGANCGQCGRELRHVPFLLKNIMCRDCYGLDRYRRSSPAPTYSPDKPREVVMTDQENAPAISST